jgi:hypothetical protein
MRKPLGEPEPEDRVGASESDALDQSNRDAQMQAETGSGESDSATKEAGSTQDWWNTPPPDPEWAQAPEAVAAEDTAIPKESATADVYFCGHTTLLSLSRALQAIAKEKLTGALRSFWDQEPIELLAQNGEILLATAKDADLYCPDTPAVLANVDPAVVASARAQQSETGTPFFLILARQESIPRQPAMELMQHYGQKLFSQLWTAPHVWIMFEKNAELLGDAGDVSGEPSADDWAMETLRFVQNPDHLNFNPGSIPAYTKDGFERIQKLKLTSDEAHFASQFNGVRSVQQIAKNLRLDLKSARMMLFRFLALEIVECWPASTATKPEKKSAFQRLGGLFRRGR